MKVFDPVVFSRLHFPGQTSLFFPWLLACATIAAFGAIIGSFLNVVVHRLPRGESIVFPNSHCPACDAAIRPLDNIPVLSYVVLRGRCRSCRAPIAWRYPALEAVTALVFALVFWRDGLSAVLPFDLVFAAMLMSLIFIDAEHMILPNAITYPGLVFALIARAVLPLLAGPGVFEDLPHLLHAPFGNWPLWAASLAGAVLGAVAGGGTLWLVGWLWERLRGVEAMGLGDVKMMFVVGAYLGWRLTVLTIFLAVLTGAVTGIFVMLRRGQRDMQMMLPFGIFLGIGSIAALLTGERIVNWYLSQFAM